VDSQCNIITYLLRVAETLSRHLLGRDWRRREENISSDDIYIFIVSLFLDNPNAYFSIHSFASTGKKNFDIEIGKWFGPLSIGQTIHQLISNWDKDFNLKCYLSQDSAIYKDEVEELIGSSWNCSLLLLLPVRLGTDVLNPVYYSGIINCLKLKQSVGIAGGRPNSAHFFIGVENEEMDKEGELGNMSDCKPCDHLLYLDPHISKPSLPVKNVYLASEFSSYHSNSAKRISIDKLDPSLLVGFYCKDENDYLEILDFVLQKQGQYPIFSAIEKKPDYSFWDSIETFE
jgi:cysteine protease ATG4